MPARVAGGLARLMMQPNLPPLPPSNMFSPDRGALDAGTVMRRLSLQGLDIQSLDAETVVQAD